MKENIVLIGFMGCGKTTVGGYLSEVMGFEQLDTDEEIVRKEGREITDIFAQDGEAYFRDAETEMLKELKECVNKKIISTGGGLPLREENAKLLKQMGFVIYLEVTEETVMERLAGDTTRPLLQGENPKEKVKNLLDYRRPLYEIAAHMTVKVDGKEVDEIADEIVRNYNMMQSVGR